MVAELQLVGNMDRHWLGGNVSCLKSDKGLHGGRSIPDQE